MEINFTIAYIQYNLSNLCSAKLSLVIAQEGFVSVAARRQECSTTNFSNKVHFVSEQQTGTFKAVYG